MKVSPFYLLAYIPLLKKYNFRRIRTHFFFQKEVRNIKNKQTTQSCCYDSASFYALFSSFNQCIYSIGTQQRFSSVQSLSHILSLQPHMLQDARVPCPSPTPGACSNSCPWSWWCHPTISSSLVPFSSCLQSFPASGSFQMSQLFASDGQGIGTSALVLPMNIQDWFPLGLTGLISLRAKGLSKSSPTPQFESINSLTFSFLYSPTLTSTHDCWRKHSFD